MKRSLSVTAHILAITFLSAPFVSSALANKDKMSREDLQAQVQTLQQAATQLRSTDPALADKLQGMAQKKQEWINNKDSKDNR